MISRDSDAALPDPTETPLQRDSDSDSDSYPDRDQGFNLELDCDWKRDRNRGLFCTSCMDIEQGKCLIRPFCSTTTRAKDFSPLE